MNDQRSDERIKEEICDRLEKHGQVDATEITVELQSGVVTLSGMVDNKEAKRLAEDSAENAPGVKDVENKLRVTSGQRDQNRQSSQQGSHGSQGSKDKHRESNRQSA